MRQGFTFFLMLIWVYPFCGFSQDFQLSHDPVFKELQGALINDDWTVSCLYNTMIYSHTPDDKLADISKYDLDEISKLAEERKISFKEFRARDEKGTLVPHIAELVHKSSIRHHANTKEPELRELLKAMGKSKSQNEFESADWVMLKNTLFYPEQVNGINILFSRKQRPEYLITIVPDIEVMKHLTFVRPYIIVTKLYHDENNRVFELAFLMVRRTREINDLIIKIYEKLNIGVWSKEPDNSDSSWYFMPVGVKDNVLPLPEAALKRLDNDHENLRRGINILKNKVEELTKTYENGGGTDEEVKKEIEKTEKILNDEAYPRNKMHRQQYEELKARWEAGDFKDTFKTRREE